MSKFNKNLNNSITVKKSFIKRNFIKKHKWFNINRSINDLEKIIQAREEAGMNNRELNKIKYFLQKASKSRLSSNELQIELRHHFVTFPNIVWKAKVEAHQNKRKTPYLKCKCKICF